MERKYLLGRVRPLVEVDGHIPLSRLVQSDEDLIMLVMLHRTHGGGTATLTALHASAIMLLDSGRLLTSKRERNSTP